MWEVPPLRWIGLSRKNLQLKTNMREQTLQDLLIVSTTSDSIEELNHKETISIWVSSEKHKKHFITSTATSTNSSSAQIGKWQPAGDRASIPSCYRVWWWAMNVNQHNLCWIIQTTITLIVWAALRSLSSVHIVLDIYNFTTWKECANSFSAIIFSPLLLNLNRTWTNFKHLRYLFW